MMMHVSRSGRLILSPRAARFLSALVLLALVCGYGLAAVLADPAPALAHIIKAIQLVGLVGGVAMFAELHFAQAYGGSGGLDERQRRERDKALALSHRLIGSGLFLIFIYASIAIDLGFWLPARREAIGLIFLVAITAMILPAAILAWRDVGPLPE
jgi:uncharacterized membrane-anchored protein